MFSKAKTLEDVRNSVYLLNEMVKTISTLGNMYYYNNLNAKILALLPVRLEVELNSVLEINQLTRKIGGLEFDTREITKKLNELVCEVLNKIRDYETTYINNLLKSYLFLNKGSTAVLAKFQKRYNIADACFQVRMLRTIINPLLREKALNPTIYGDQIGEFLDSSEEKLKRIEAKIFDDSIRIMQNVEVRDISKIFESIRDMKQKTIEYDLIKEISKPGLDMIEATLEILDHKFFGLRSVKEDLIKKRVLDKLPDYLKAYRRALRLRYDNIYLNWGSISPSFDFASRAAELWTLDLDQHGPVSVFSERLLETSGGTKNVLYDTREAISKMLNCQNCEVILTHNTTHGIRLALYSINFKGKGDSDSDRILLTSLEHDTAFNCCRIIKQRFNVDYEVIHVSEDSSGETIARSIIDKSYDGKTKVVILSHVIYNTGQVVDVKKVIDEVRKNLGDKAPLFIVDGAQAVGHIPVDFKDIDCEFYAADGHKWLMGPTGIGFLCVKAGYLNRHKDQFSFYESYMTSKEYRPSNPQTGLTYEPSTLSITPYIGLQKVVKAFNNLQAESPSIFKRMQSLTKYFRELIMTELKDFEVRIIKPKSSSSIVPVRFHDKTGHSFYDEIRKRLDEEFHIQCRSLHAPMSLASEEHKGSASLRFCISYLNSKEELKLAVSCVGKIMEEKYPHKEETRLDKESLKQLEKQREDTRKNIENLYEHVKILLKKLEEKTEMQLPRKFKDAEEQYKHKINELAKLKQQILKEIHRATSEEYLIELERKARIEFNKLLPGI